MQAWVTGAGTPVGAAVAARLEAEGARVLRSSAPRTEQEANEQLAGLDRLDILVTAQRAVQVRSLLQSEASDFDAAISDNLTSVFVAMRAAMRKIGRDSGGSILIISSIHGEKPNGAAPLFSTACGGLNMLTREAALELGRFGVRVNLLAIGPLEGDPEQFPSDVTTFYDDAASKMPRRRLGTPAEIAAVAAFVCSSEASFVNGALIPCDGGLLGYYVDADTERRWGAFQEEST